MSHHHVGRRDDKDVSIATRTRSGRGLALPLVAASLGLTTSALLYYVHTLHVRLAHLSAETVVCAEVSIRRDDVSIDSVVPRDADLDAIDPARRLAGVDDFLRTCVHHLRHSKRAQPHKTHAARKEPLRLASVAKTVAPVHACALGLSTQHPTAVGFRVTMHAWRRGTTVHYHFDAPVRLRKAWGPVSAIEHYMGAAAHTPARTSLAFRLDGEQMPFAGRRRNLTRTDHWGFALLQPYTGRFHATCADGATATSPPAKALESAKVPWRREFAFVGEREAGRAATSTGGRRLAARRQKGGPTVKVARRDSECVQIPAKPNQPVPPSLAHAQLDAASTEAFDLASHRASYCAWYNHIGSGYHACKAFPSPNAPCKAALRASGLLPSHARLVDAVAILSSRSILLIGDSTMLNKFILLRFLGVRSSCEGGAGVCFLPTCVP